MNTVIKMISIAVFALLLSSCQKTPEELVVQNKNDNELEQKINATDIQETSGILPEYFSESIETDDGYLRVNIDAVTVLPEVKAYPVVEIEPMEITQEWADKIIFLFIGDTVMYEKQYARTTDELTTEIQASYQYIKDELAEYEKTDPDYYKRKYSSTIEWIAYLNGLLETSTNERKIHSRKFEGMNIEVQSDDAEATREYLESKGYSEDEIEEMMNNYNNQINQQEFISGVADLGKARMASIDINKYSAKQQVVLFYNTESGGSTGTDFLTLEDPGVETNISYEQALKLSKELISGIGIEGMEMYERGYAPNYDENEFKSGYIHKLIFTRTFNEVPVTYVSESRYKTLNSEQLYREPWRDEKLEISIDKTGVIGFEWINPVRVNQVINNNVEILPFEQIKNTFSKQILINNAYREEGNTESVEININRITLGLVKIAKKNSDEYMYVPAWDFFGTITEEYIDDMGSYIDDRYGVSFMTINAIDGTIIDRNLEY